MSESWGSRPLEAALRTLAIDLRIPAPFVGCFDYDYDYDYDHDSPRSRDSSRPDDFVDLMARFERELYDDPRVGPADAERTSVARRDPSTLIGRNLGSRFRLDAISSQTTHSVVYAANIGIVKIESDDPGLARTLLQFTPSPEDVQTAARD